MFKTIENELSDKLAPFDSQVQMKDEPLCTGKHSIHILSAKRGQGKTTLLLNLFKRKSSPYYKYFDNIFLFSSSAKNDDKMNDLINELEPENKFFSEYNEENLQTVLTMIEELNEERKEENEELPKSKRKEIHNLIIFDDVIHAIAGRGKKDSLFNKLVTTNRHMKTSLIVTTQRYNLLGTLIRSNADMLTIFPSDSRQEIETIIHDLSIDEDKFKKVFAFATDEPFSFLHINFCGRRPVFYKKFNKIIIEETPA